MTLLNRKIDYALLILCYLHLHKGGGCAREIAGSLKISRAFVANILKSLCQKGFVASHRGVKGGYSLEEATQTKTLADLIHALDDSVQLAECNDAEACCTLARHCPIRAPIEEVHERILGVLQSVTLEGLFTRANFALIEKEMPGVVHLNG